MVHLALINMIAHTCNKKGPTKFYNDNIVECKDKTKISAYEFVSSITIKLKNPNIAKYIVLKSEYKKYSLIFSCDFLSYYREAVYKYNNSIYNIDFIDMTGMFVFNHPCLMDYWTLYIIKKECPPKNTIANKKNNKKDIFDVLPFDLWDMIMKKVDTNTWANLRCTSRGLYHVSQKKDIEERFYKYSDEMKIDKLYKTEMIVDARVRDNFRMKNCGYPDPIDYIYLIDNLNIVNNYNFNLDDFAMYIMIPDPTVKFLVEYYDEKDFECHNAKKNVKFRPLKIKYKLSVPAIKGHIKRIIVSKPTRVFVGYGRTILSDFNIQKEKQPGDHHKSITKIFKADQKGSIEVDLLSFDKEMIDYLIMNVDFMDEEKVKATVEVNNCGNTYDYFVMNKINLYKMRESYDKNKLGLYFNNEKRHFPLYCGTKVSTATLKVEGLTPLSDFNIVIN